MMAWTATAAALLAGAMAAGGWKAPDATPLDAAAQRMNAPAAPFRISRDIYFVGTADIGVYLIPTAKGLILIDTGFAQGVDRLLANIRALGFDPRDIRLILVSQAHGDHVGGDARIKALTGARVVAGAREAALLARGGKGDPNFADRVFYPPVKLDRPVRDGEQVSLGGVTLTAHLTPGHTKGCTTWTMPTRIEGREVGALFLCGVTAPGYRLVGNPAWPDAVGDFRRSFATLRGLKCELFLGAHGGYYGFTAKRAEMVRTGSARAFIDPTGCRAYLTAAEKEIEAQAEAQRRR
jgi:metallo-beta-lactamase class B